MHPFQASALVDAAAVTQDTEFDLKPCLTLAHRPHSPQIVVVEEPENGLHPRRLQNVVEVFRAMTEGEFGGNPAQVILTTHSPYLLDHIDLSKDRVLVFQREEDGRRTAKAADEARLKPFLDEFMLGELWFNNEEEGLLTKGTE